MNQARVNDELSVLPEYGIRATVRDYDHPSWIEGTKKKSVGMTSSAESAEHELLLSLTKELESKIHVMLHSIERTWIESVLATHSETVHLPEVPSIATPQEDFQWFVANPAQTADFKGQYVAILNKKIVAHGAKIGEVLKNVREHKFPRRPLIALVPDKEPQAFSSL